MSNREIWRIPKYNTPVFASIWKEYDDFDADFYQYPQLYESIGDDEKKILFTLLLARYGTSPIANMTIDAFKLKVFTIIWQYGPSWSKRLEIQKKIRELSDEELTKGTKQIHNHAYNPETITQGGTGDFNLINSINEQTQSGVIRGKMDAYSMVWNLIDTDVSEDFLRRFKSLFKVFVMPENPLLYITSADGTEMDDDEEEDY